VPYAARKVTIEPMFGQTKRGHGFFAILMGIEEVRSRQALSVPDTKHLLTPHWLSNE